MNQSKMNVNFKWLVITLLSSLLGVWFFLEALATKEPSIIIVTAGIEIVFYTIFIIKFLKKQA